MQKPSNKPIHQRHPSISFQLHAKRSDYLLYDTPKLFTSKYVVYTFNIVTSYTDWEISYRYSEFLNLHLSFVEKYLISLPKIPPKKYFSLGEAEIEQRFVLLEEYINAIFKNINIIYYPELVLFFNAPNDVIALYYDKLSMSKKTANVLKSTSLIRTKSSTNSKNETTLMNNNTTSMIVYSKDSNSMNSNYFNNLHQFKLHDNNMNISSDKSPNALVVEEFLRNLQDNKDNKSEIVQNFEIFMTNSEGGWNFFRKKEIQYFFNGIYLDQSTTNNTEDALYINSFLFHIGNVQINPLGSQKSLEFLSKILSFDINPQYDEFVEEYKNCSIEQLLSMELEKHIMSTFTNIQQAACNVLNIYVGDSRHLSKKIQRILNCPIAEKKFLKWVEDKEKNESVL